MTISYGFSLSLQGLYFLALARLLGASGMGTFAAVLAVATVAAYASGMGSGNVLVKRVATDPGVLPSMYGAACIWIFGLGSVMTIAAYLTGAEVAPGLSQVTLLLFISECIFTRLADLNAQAFQSRDELKKTGTLNAAQAAVRAFTALACLLILSHVSATAWAFSYLAVQAVFALIGFVLVSRHLGRPKVDWRTVRSIPREGVWFVVGQASRAVYTDLDKTMLAIFAGGAIAGNYTVAYRLMSFAFAPLQALVYSSNTRLYRAGAKGYESSAPVVRRMIIFVSGYAVLSAALIAAFHWVPQLVLGKSYELVDQILLWLIPMVLITGLHYALGDALMGLGRQWARALFQVLAASAAVGLYVWLIPALSWRGAVMGTWVSEGILVLGFILVFRFGLARARAHDGIDSSLAGTFQA